MYLNFIYISLFYSSAWFIYLNGSHNDIFYMYSNQSGKFQVKDMNVYIEPFIDELLKLWNGTTMYDVSRPI